MLSKRFDIFPCCLFHSIECSTLLYRSNVIDSENESRQGVLSRLFSEETRPYYHIRSELSCTASYKERISIRSDIGLRPYPRVSRCIPWVLILPLLMLGVFDRRERVYYRVMCREKYLYDNRKSIRRRWKGKSRSEKPVTREANKRTGLRRSGFPGDVEIVRLKLLPLCPGR